MEKKFWINAWEEGRTGFHQAKLNDKLLQYFPSFSPRNGQTVLVPLCGKSRDMLWLKDQGLRVRGVELYERPVREFFTENKLTSPQITQDQDFKNFSSGDIEISCGDFFRLNSPEHFDFIYDRASLVALPKEMRKTYAAVVTKALKTGGLYLLMTCEYDETELQGPPFSVSFDEIRELFSESFTIEQKENLRPDLEGSRLQSVGSYKQAVYILHKR